MKKKITKLITDKSFIELVGLINEPNYYKINGISQSERVHSHFWSWILDANGSHNLNDFSFNKLFTLLLQDDIFKSNNTTINDFFPYKKLETSTTTPNENNKKEYSVNNVGRFDIYSELSVVDYNNKHIDISVLIEMKIGDSTKKEQSNKYAEWQLENKKDHKKILIYFIPGSKLIENSEKSVGDERWNVISYQQLYDNILLPTLNHKSLSSHAKNVVIEYIKNLKTTIDGFKLATTQEEKLLINNIYEEHNEILEKIISVLELKNRNTEEKNLIFSIYENHKEVFDNIFTILDSEKKLIFQKNETNRKNGNFSVMFNNEIFDGQSSRELLEKILIYLVDNDLIKYFTLPWGTGSKRYILSTSDNAFHINGNTFFSKIEYKNYVIETHNDREKTRNVINDISKNLNVEWKLIEY